MKIVGIVAEYNPFHNGHLYHLNKAKELSGADYSVAIISSNFVQRGEPSIFTKWQRSEMAVKNGVDLVLELPVLFSSRSAYHFAFGSIYSLIKSNVITHIAFGSEEPTLEELYKIAGLLANESFSFQNTLKEYLKKGCSFPKAREKAIRDILPEIKLDLNQPNVILGINYLKVLLEEKSKIIPVPIKRVGEYHGLSPKENIAGATLIRNLIKDNDSNYKNFLPDKTKDIINHALQEEFTPVFLEKFTQQIMYLLRTMNCEDYLKFPGINEGLENRLISKLFETNKLDELVKKINNKRFTETRINRILIEILLGITREYDNYSPEYIRVLAFNNKGRNILNELKNKSSLPLITKFADFYNLASGVSKKQLDLEIRSTNIYSQIQNNKKYNSYNMEFTKSPLYLA